MATFVGFGFGAIQAGLFLYEAHQSGAFDRLVVAEVLPARVAALRQAGGILHINVAHADGVKIAAVGPVEIYNPAVAEDRAVLVEAIAAADELATAIPSVSFYTGEGPGSLHRVLAAGLDEKVRRQGPQAVLYAAENHNEAAQILQEAVDDALVEAAPAEAARYLAFLNTVIGKMSGVVPLDGAATADGLIPVTPEADEAYLVESFNRILVSQPHLPTFPDQPRFVRRLDVFAEKPDLLPFEEAKLYGHNAMHAMAGYLAALLGLETMAELRQHPDVLALVREAGQAEAGAALCRRYAGADPLFSVAGFADYVDDLLVRMVNPFLRDGVARVTRDPARKLGWNDRLIGAMRMTLAEDGEPRRLAMGAAAALTQLPAADSAHGSQEQALAALWLADSPSSAEVAVLSAWIERGQRDLALWDAGHR